MISLRKGFEDGLRGTDGVCFPLDFPRVENHMAISLFAPERYSMRFLTEPERLPGILWDSFHQQFSGVSCHE